MRRASVNNLGFGGSNAHVVLEETPRLCDRSENINLPDGFDSEHTNGRNSERTNGFYSDSGPPVAPEADNAKTTFHRLFVLTAKDEEAVKAQMRNLKSYLKNRSGKITDDWMFDLAFTLGQRRSLLAWRISLVASTADALMEQLQAVEAVPTRAARKPNLGFVFTGQGANWHAMGRELLQTYPEFSSTIVAADKELVGLGAQWSLIGSCLIASYSFTS